MLFSELGSSKQNRRIVVHLGQILAVVLDVGAAFDFLAEFKPQALSWTTCNALEWAIRLASEPRRLAGRYLKNSPHFVALMLHQWIKAGFSDA